MFIGIPWWNIRTENYYQIIANEHKNLEKRKELLADISDYFKGFTTLLAKAETALNREDPIFSHLNTVMSAYRNALDDIVGFIEMEK
jgi:hypothetical protein